jgi:polysaccharide biosynthesis protein PslG
MSRITRLVLCALAAGAVAAAALLLAAPAAAPKHPILGIGDDKPDLFKDPRFLALGIKNVRLDMSWDALSVSSQRAEVTTWMQDAKADGLSVLVTIDHSERVITERVHGSNKKVSQSRVLPTVAQYRSAFLAFRTLFPWVTEFATWDETNYFGEATYDKEALVVGYYRAMKQACPGCTILAAEFLDVPKSEGVPMTTWAQTFIKLAGVQPQYWGLNNYEDANHLVSTRTRQLLAAVHGNIWLAETGGIVNRLGVKDPGFPQNAAHAATVDSYLLDRIGSLSRRIQRIYLYEWDAKTPHDGWDTALISYTGAPREGYDVVARTLESWGIKPNCTISSVPPNCARLPATP